MALRGRCPGRVLPDKVEASLQRGVLKVDLPKQPDDEPAVSGRRINVASEEQ